MKMDLRFVAFHHWLEAVEKGVSMPTRTYLSRLACMTMMFAFVSVIRAAAQSPPPFLIQSFPDGLRPLGVAYSGSWVVVANSRDDSVSVFAVTGYDIATGGPPIGLRPRAASLGLSKVIRGIPSPYAVSPCSNGVFVVTSPSSNLVSVVSGPEGKVLGTIKVGAQPYSATCNLVSNYGDNSLSVLDLSSYTVTKTIPNVPGSRGLHGIASQFPLSQIAWVTGTDANVLTRVDVNASAVLTRIPFPGPDGAVLGSRNNSQVPDTLFIFSSASNSVDAIGLSTFQISPFAIVPTPQDFAIGNLGMFASTGFGNSVLQVRPGNDTIPGIPGAAGLVAGGVLVSYDFQGPRPVPPIVVVTAPDSNSVFLIQAQPPTPSRFRASNGASFGTAPIAPGTLASIFTSTGVSQNFTANSLPLPRVLGGLTLSIGGTLNFDPTSGWKYSPTGSIQAPLFFVGPNQINFQLPPGISLGDSVSAQLTNPDGSTLLTTLRITAIAPGIFTVPQNGQGQGAVLNQDNSQNFGTNPARRGTVIQIYATGAGETDPPLLPGEPAPLNGNPLILTRVQPTVTIGGQTARVLFSGMAPGFVGLWQINAEVPQNVAPGSAVPLVITAGGVSSNTVTIAIE